MNDASVFANVDGVSSAPLAPLIAFAFAPLLVKTTTIRCKIKPEAWPWLDQAAREVNQVWNFANETSFQSSHYYARRSLPVSDNPKFGKPHPKTQAAQERAKAKQNAKKNKAGQTGKAGKSKSDGKPKEKTYDKTKWLSAFELNLLVSGCGEVFERIGVDVAQKVNAEFVQKRTQAKLAKLRFRASGGSKRALGWIPFKAVNIRQKGDSLTFMGKRIRLFNLDYYLEHRKSAMRVCEGSFAQNSLGEWFLNQVMEVAFLRLPPLKDMSDPDYMLGIDPGKDISLSTGEKLVYGFYREAEQKIAELQKNGRKKQAKYLADDVKNKRLNEHHQDTTELIREHGEIYIGDSSIARMKQKKGAIAMGKSLSDNAIGQFKTFLNYKGHWAGRKIVLVNEKNTTQVCSNCGQKTGPKGLKQLAVRKWICSACGVEHDRDHNASKNMPGAQVSSKNEAFQPRSGLLFAETR